MRHRKKFNHLGRNSAHRKAMLANMANSLILHKRIKTTVAKAKALRMYVEPLITKSKDDSTSQRRVVFSYLKNKYAVSELFREVAGKIGDRPGGYTRILKLGNRLGDNAEMCYIELVDYNENMLSASKSSSDKKKRRTRRKKATSTADVETAVVENEVAAKDVEAETKAPADSETPEVKDTEGTSDEENAKE